MDSVDTHHKALRVNGDLGTYGTFAEIGAGQEVARWFFRVGGASGTIAKTISAYDMLVSDAIYGHTDRYVSRRRLGSMLEYEFKLMRERLDARRGADTRFFVFADTVATRSHSRQGEAHGWIGIQFQNEPRADPSQIMVHVRMLDKENVQQQEALGIVGVNLIHAALYTHHQLLNSLLDNLTRERVEVDMIKLCGHGFEQVDNRLTTLELVQEGLTDAAMFTADGEVVQAAEVLYNKPILVERGSFRPVTNTTLDMLESGHAQFVKEPQVEGEEVVVVMEMTLKNLSAGAAGEIDPLDFLDRVDILSALGKTVLISNYGEFHRLASYLFRYTKRMIGIVMGAPTLRDIFEEKYYTDLDGGILESFGRLFKNDLKFYVYPFLDLAAGTLTTANNLDVAPHLRHLYAYLYENYFIRSVQPADPRYLRIFSRDVLSRIQSRDEPWQEMVPPVVADLIKERRLFGYRETKRATA